MASPVDLVASVSQRCAHNAQGSIAVGVVLRCLPHLIYVLTGPFPFLAARVSPNCLMHPVCANNQSQVVCWYKIL